MSKIINPSMIIADVLNRWPETIPVFLENNMACVGCSMAPFMTISDAMEIYQLATGEFMDQLHKALDSAGLIDADTA